MALTIGETISQLHSSLSDYIEATYHISDPILIKQRKRLLNQQGVIQQKPYLESTPRYEIGEKFNSNEGLSEAAVSIFESVATESGDLKRIIYDPPYSHQAASIKRSLVDGQSLIVMTGTGSGKTECFLLPILGKLAIEAKDRNESFSKYSAVRAMVLYPMNALVNDQLGRLRLMFGDQRIVKKFEEWGGRPARFARYTSRTLYPGVRTSKKDQLRLKPIEDYYVKHLLNLNSPDQNLRETSERLVSELKKRGKFPAKSDLVAWYGEKGSRWTNSEGEFVRCVTLPDDPELFTRHEVLDNPPDILVTNYSMLEYMLMRPLERPVFDATKKWLQDNPEEKFMLVVDEAHLYKGSGGTEVALLIRRLRQRLEISAERFQVICTSASFDSEDNAREFSAQLSGKDPKDFSVITGTLALRERSNIGSKDDANALASIDTEAFYSAEAESERMRAVRSFLEYRGVEGQENDVRGALYVALADFGPMNLLINESMRSAKAIDELGKLLFSSECDPKTVEGAVTSLVAIGSAARRSAEDPGLLPCRIHSFFRGLPGLWACLNQHCDGLAEEERGGPTGYLYSQPRTSSCKHCGCRVFELYTCRNCGVAYVRAYTDDVESPSYLWSEPGERFKTSFGTTGALESIDILLEEPLEHEIVEPVEIALESGRMNLADDDESNVRTVFLKKDRTPQQNEEGVAQTGSLGEFKPCGVCGKSASFGRSSVQDHLTKGDQPFQTLVTSQLQVQQPDIEAEPTSFAPLRGRKVLIFSDSRQTAARLAPNIQSFSNKDLLKPLIIKGFQELFATRKIAKRVSLADVYLATLLAAHRFNTVLRPTLRGTENFNDQTLLSRLIDSGEFEEDPIGVLMEFRTKSPPESLLAQMLEAIRDRYYGLESLALASFREVPKVEKRIHQLPDLEGFADDDQKKLELVRIWLRTCAGRSGGKGIWLDCMPESWMQNEISPFGVATFPFVKKVGGANAEKAFKQLWLERLTSWFLKLSANNKYFLRGDAISLLFEGDWRLCAKCREVQRSHSLQSVCVNCFSAKIAQIDPEVDPVFRARKAFYRDPIEKALKTDGTAPIGVVAAEHTAQLNTAQDEDVFSMAEENELLFQDVDLGKDEHGTPRKAVDILSCTTTMEVGIDIGSLAGVALRNLPPARSNYQQRAGRAGRRGNSVATVVAFGSSDSHDEHYFSNSHEMISGPVLDPFLTLDNLVITRRHVLAYLLQRYHRDRLPVIADQEQSQLFEVLGTVAGFRGSQSVLNYFDFETWLTSEREEVTTEIENWVPVELDEEDRTSLLEGFPEMALEDLGKSLLLGEWDREGAGEDVHFLEGNLIDRLLYTGVLPRYAFPTDVATFYVFDQIRSDRYRTYFRFKPSQGLSVALNQYAPGKELTISGTKYTSGAIYSEFQDDRFDGWRKKRFYFQCANCTFAFLHDSEVAKFTTCPGCGSPDSFGTGYKWFRPPGFAHPVFVPEDTKVDDSAPPSYATRAKLDAPVDPASWVRFTDVIKTHYTRDPLMVSNLGPKDEGYNYCTTCGLISPSVGATSNIDASKSHNRPYPPTGNECAPPRTAKRVVLGTDFSTDLLLISFALTDPINLKPGVGATNAVMRTLCEAMSTAACRVLELDPSEMQSEFRPSQSDAGRRGHEVELYLYDTLAGGAGFARKLQDRLEDLFGEALRIVSNCEEDCDSSCYRCLRSYKNKFEHHLLDRQLAKQFLGFVTTSEIPAIDEVRKSLLLGQLVSDLRRVKGDNVVIEENKLMSVPGIGDFGSPLYISNREGQGIAIEVSSALTPDHSRNTKFDLAKEMASNFPCLILDELQVMKNLPSSSSQILRSIGL